MEINIKYPNNIPDIALLCAALPVWYVRILPVKSKMLTVDLNFHI